MSAFKLSETIDENKIFITYRRDINGRLDPAILLYQKKTSNFKYESYPLGSLIIINPQYGANEAGIERKSIEETRYIRITDIDGYGLLKSDLGKTAKIIDIQYILNNNDILFARSGATVGKSYIHKKNSVPYECFFAGYMIRFIFDETKVVPDYIFAYTQLRAYAEWVTSIQRAAGQPNINAEEYKSLQIPLPPIATQNQIVDKMAAAYADKKAMEEKARELLDGADDFLLSELGISLPDETENAISGRIFYPNFSDVFGSRMDGNAYHNNRVNAIKSISSGAYETKKLGNLCSFRKSIVSESSDDIPYIGLENIESDTGFYTPSKTKVDFSSAVSFELGFVLFPKLRPYLNKVYYAEFDGVCSTEFHVLDVPELNNEYLSNFLRSQIVVRQTIQLMSGNTLPRLQTEDIRSLLVPIPPLDKQKKIVEKIDSIRSQAKQIRKEAVEGLERAKTEIEAMIMGKE